MHKRFTDCDKYDDVWFRKLPTIYKLFWDYVCARCDNSGVWKVDMESAVFHIGEPQLRLEEALRIFNDKKERVITLPNGSLFLKDFISFQYGELGTTSNPHRQVWALIKKNGIEGYLKATCSLKDKDQDKDQGKDKDGRGAGKPKNARKPSPDCTACTDGFLPDKTKCWCWK